MVMFAPCFPSMVCGRNADDRQRTAGCGHEFCWICLAPWAEHRSHTDFNYFQCPRGGSASASNAAQRKLLRGEVVVEMAVTRYERLSDDLDAYEAHLASWDIEVRFIDDAAAKAEQLAASPGDAAAANMTRSVLDVFATLCDARRLLACTRAWCCVRRWKADRGLVWIPGLEETVREHQGELFGATEALSDMVARQRWTAALVDIAAQADVVRATVSKLRQALRQQNSVTEAEVEAAEARQVRMERLGGAVATVGNAVAAVHRATRRGRQASAHPGAYAAAGHALGNAAKTASVGLGVAAYLAGGAAMVAVAPAALGASAVVGLMSLVPTSTEG